MKSHFEGIIHWNKYLWKRSGNQTPEKPLKTDVSLQEVDWLFVLIFGKETSRIEQTGYYFPTKEIKDYNMMIHGRNSFDQLVNIITYDSIRKITTGTGDDYTTNCLLYYTNFKVHYKLIAIDLIKRQPLNLDPKTHKYISQEI